MAHSIHSSMGASEIPPIRWSETYEDSTVLVAMLHTPDSFQHLDPEAQLEWYHGMASRLDDALLPLSEHVWKVQTFTMPFYCLVCPDVNLSSHADHLVSLALDLRAAAQQTSFEQAASSVSIGICSGQSAVGLIGQDGLSFYLTGRVIHTAKQLAEEGHQLVVHESTWTRMGDRAQASYTWQRVHTLHAPGAVYVAVQPHDGPVGEDDELPCYLPDLHCLAGAAPYPRSATLGNPAVYTASSSRMAVPGAAGGAALDAVPPSAAAAGSGQPGKGDTVYVDDVDSAWYSRSRALMTPAEADMSRAALAADGRVAADGITSGSGGSKAAAAGGLACEPAPAARQDSPGVLATLSSLLRQRWGN